MAEENAPKLWPSTFTEMKTQLNVVAPKADEAIKFYQEAFGAVLVERASYLKRKADADQPLVTAEIKIAGRSFLVCDNIADELPPADGEDNAAARIEQVVFRLETDKVEDALTRAMKAGAVPIVDPCMAMTFVAGGEFEKVKDPFGVIWVIASPPAAAEVEKPEPEANAAA